MARVQYFGKTTASTSVTVYWAGTTTKPTIYGSATGSSISNPLTSSFEGDYSFWVDEGHYKILNGKLVNGVATNIDDAYILSTQGAEPTASKSSLAPFQTNTATDVEEWVEGAYTGATYVAASALKSATTVVGVAAATAPSSGQVLTATSSTTATWQTPSTVTVPGADTNLVYNDGGALGADANLTWNKTTKVHTLTGGYYANTQAVATTSTDGMVLATSNTATSGNQKYSPAVRLRGSYFSGSAKTTDLMVDNEPTSTGGVFTVKHSDNGAAYTTRLAVGPGIKGFLVYNAGGYSFGWENETWNPTTQVTFVYNGGGAFYYSNAYGLVVTQNVSAAGFGITTSVASAPDVMLIRGGAANWSLGSTAANPPVAQTLSVQDASGTDIAGATWTFRASRGTGAGAVTGKAFSWQTPDVGATGTTLQTATEKWYMNSTGELVNTLPVAATSTDGLVLATSATATSGNQKFSPRTRYRGSYFSGSAKTTDWTVDNQPTSAGGYLAFSHSDNGAAYANVFYVGSDGNAYISNAYQIGTPASLALSITNSNFYAKSTFIFGWSSGSNPLTTDTILSRAGAANVRMGDVAANPPVAQTLSVQDASGTDIAGATWTFRGSRGTGTGTPGSIAFQTSTALGTGTTLQTATTRLTISSTAVTSTLPVVVPGYTVANLPTGVTGMRAYVTDANATTFLSTVAGGGSNTVPVFYNGTNWVIG